MDWSVVGVTFVTLLVIMDPVGAAPIFVSLTREFSPQARHRAIFVSTCEPRKMFGILLHRAAARW